MAKLSRLPCRPEVQHFSRAPHHQEDFDRRRSLADEVVARLHLLETKISQALSLRSKFLREETARTVRDNASPEDQESVTRYMEEFVRDLYCKPEVTVMGGPRGPA